MPKNKPKSLTKNKSKKDPKKGYDEEMIHRALADIRNGESKKSVAKKYGIPRSTLQFRLSSKFTKTRPGPNTYLTTDEEIALANWILESQKKRIPKTKS